MLEFLSAFVLTLVIELPVLYLVLRGRVRTGLIVVTGILSNVSTLPIVWFVFPVWLEGIPYTIISEVFAVGAECLIMRLALRVGWKSACLASILANASSFVIGLALLR